MFDSCSAYQSSRELLFLSHCVPNPPDKGEKIRAFHILNRLAKEFRIHLVCFARNSSEADYAHQLLDRCSSVHVEVLPARTALMYAAFRYATGASLTTSYYRRGPVSGYVEQLVRTRPLAASFCYSSVVTQFAPRNIPLFLDFVDVDSEKWFQYGNMRQPAFAYRIEARRLRQLEQEDARRAVRSFLTTRQELELLHSFIPGAAAGVIENGVDFDYFDPAQQHTLREAAGRNFIVFTGVMNYFPNAQAVCSFAAEVFPALRCMQPELEFLIVGRDPSAAVRKLERIPGITVTGSVPDIRPYLASSSGVVAPLGLARGIQNKVLEALSMGKRAFCSQAVCKTFGRALPEGVVRCETPLEFITALSETNLIPGAWNAEIRQAARRRFSWERNLNPIAEAIASELNVAATGAMTDSTI